MPDAGAAGKPEPAPPAAGRPPVGNTVDVRGLIKQASTRVSLDQLAQRGAKYVSLVSKQKIDELVNQAVKTIIDKYRALAAGVGDVPEDQLQAESRQEFGELLQQYKETSAAKGQLEQTKAALDAELAELRKDLEAQKSAADGRLAEELEKSFLLGVSELDRELDRCVGKAFEKRRIILGAEGDPKVQEELAKIEGVLRPLLARLVAVERRRFAAAGGRDQEVEVLQKRIEKLYEQMAALENALRTISNSKLYSNQHIQNLLRQLGLGVEEKNAEKKREMLKIVLEQNREMRKLFKGQPAPVAPAAGDAAPPAGAGPGS